MARADVKAALHLKVHQGSAFSYGQTGPASITLWPQLAKKSVNGVPTRAS